MGDVEHLFSSQQKLSVLARFLVLLTLDSAFYVLEVEQFQKLVLLKRKQTHLFVFTRDLVKYPAEQKARSPLQAESVAEDLH